METLKPMTNDDRTDSHTDSICPGQNNPDERHKTDLETNNNNVPKTLAINNLVGDFGLWQANIAFFYFVAYILSTFNNLGIAFHAAKTDYHCDYDPIKHNLSNIRQSNQTDQSFTSNQNSLCGHCDNWTFNNSINFDETIISEFGLTCGQEWLTSFSQSIYHLGYVISGIVIGYISDSYGRYLALWIAIVFEILGGSVLIMSNSIYVYILARLILGFGDSGRGGCLYMLIIETVGKKHRTDAILMTSFGWVVGYILLPTVAYLLLNYRYLQMVPTVCMTLMVLLWLPTISESPRWLLTNEKFSRANKTLKQACKWNGKLDDNFENKFNSIRTSSMKMSENSVTINQNKTTTNQKVTILDLMKSRKYRRITPILWLSFYVSGFIYHGFSLNVDIIGGNVFLNFAIAGLVEIPSIVLNLVGMRYVGRKTFTISTILSATVSYGVIVLLRLVWQVPTHHPSVLAISMLGKLFIFSTYNAIYIHAGEIFPTQLRQTGVSSCSIAARFGSTMSPFVKEFAAKFGLTITMMLFGGMALVTSFLSLFLPETKDKELVDHVDLN